MYSDKTDIAELTILRQPCIAELLMYEVRPVASAIDYLVVLLTIKLHNGIIKRQIEIYIECLSHIRGQFALEYLMLQKMNIVFLQETFDGFLTSRFAAFLTAETFQMACRRLSKFSVNGTNNSNRQFMFDVMHS